MDYRPLTRRFAAHGLQPSVVGFGAFKIGRNEGIKYAAGYDLPDDAAVAALLDRVIDLGITLIDTAPAYGTSEERLGQHLAGRRDQLLLSTKVGETFEAGTSTYDFTSGAIRQSVQRSLRRLRTDHVDLLLIHSDGNDRAILEESDAVETVIELRDAGLARAIGFSGKTVDGARTALSWADAIMVEYHLDDTSHDAVMREAGDAGIGVLVKKGLASGRLPAADAIRFVLDHPALTSLVIGGLNPGHLATNVGTALEALRDGAE